MIWALINNIDILSRQMIMKIIVLYCLFLLLCAPALSDEGGRYTQLEQQRMLELMRSLEGKQRKCVSSFVRGYEVYAYPHCMKYRNDKSFCKQYKNTVPISVVDTAFDICDVQWLSIE